MLSSATKPNINTIAKKKLQNCDRYDCFANDYAFGIIIIAITFG